jgi:membrane-associated phospholipid phosphatase
VHLSRNISAFLSNLALTGFVFLYLSSDVYSQNLQTSDSNNIKHSSSEKTDINIISIQKPTTNFYKTDSIFSFHSSKGYFPSLLCDFGEQIVTPFKHNTKQLIITGAAVGITVALFHIDGDIDEWARTQKQKHKWINKSSPVITNFGGDWGVCSVIATGLLGAAFKDEKVVQTSLLATQAMITSGVWANITKVLTGRERPMADYAFSNTEGGIWYGPFALWDQDLAKRKPVTAFDAFPSGHTATAFSIATVFAMQYKDNKAIPVICYSAATLVGISRLTEHEHWASDVFVGGFLGYICGRQVVNHYNKTHQNQANSLSHVLKNKTEFTLLQNGNQIGFSLKW